MKLHRHSPLRGPRKHPILSEGCYLFDFSSTPARVRRNMCAAIQVIAARHDSVEFPDGQDCALTCLRAGLEQHKSGLANEQRDSTQLPESNANKQNWIKQT